MALINCPECSKEISDKVTSCPHCGYPLVDDSAQKVELSSIKLKLDRRKKKIILGTIGGLLLLTIAVLGINSSIKEQKRQEAIAEQARIEQQEQARKEKYIEDIRALMTTLLTDGIEAEDYLGLVDRVWYNTIYKKSDEETDEYTKKDGVWNEDFNDSLSKVYAIKFFEISSLDSSVETTGEELKKLNNPPEEYKDIHENLLSLYVSYESYINFAKDPSGSLMTFRESANSKADKFLEDYNKLKAIMPEVEEGEVTESAEENEI